MEYSFFMIFIFQYQKYKKNINEQREYGVCLENKKNNHHTIENTHTCSILSKNIVKTRFWDQSFLIIFHPKTMMLDYHFFFNKKNLEWTKQSKRCGLIGINFTFHRIILSLNNNFSSIIPCIWVHRILILLNNNARASS